MKVDKLKWYHRLWNVCISPITVSIITIVTLVCPFIYIIFGEDGLDAAFDWAASVVAFLFKDE